MENKTYLPPSYLSIVVLHMSIKYYIYLQKDLNTH